MMERGALVAGAVFVAVLFALTVHTAVTAGPSVLTVLSALVLAMIGAGLVGALRE